MKVVYCGALEWYPHAPDHLGIKQGMEDLGWDWSIVDPIKNDPTNTEIAAAITSINPDIVIYGDTNSLAKSVCPYVTSGITQIFWMLDYRTPEMLRKELNQTWLSNSPYLTAVFTSSGSHIQLWQDSLGVQTYFAPHACYIPSKLEMSDAFSYDFLYIGGKSPLPVFSARTDFIAQIEEFSDIPLTHINEVDLIKRNEVWRDMPLYYHSSKVVLDISHFWDNWGYSSGRYWYTATFGACTITKRFPGCTQFFPDTFKWYFDTPEQAVELVKFALNDDAEREATKQRVSHHAWQNHNYKIRFQQMLQCLETGKQVEMF
ncbi:MAG: glycosyltransferase family protein [Candidatus Hodarchaeales archaeon]